MVSPTSAFRSFAGAVADRTESLGGYLEFFAGGGMARAGLGPRWRCLFANDNDPKKAASYARNWGAENLLVADIHNVRSDQLPGNADLAWASFPCQDLSLAGAGAGLRGERSGTFWPFWRLIEKLDDSDAAPTVIALENVCGAITSHGGDDFRLIARVIAKRRYKLGALVIDAVNFLPQSRPRLFIVAVKRTSVIPLPLLDDDPHEQWHPSDLVRVVADMTSTDKKDWVWWRLPSPDAATQRLIDLIEHHPDGVKWHPRSETRRLIAMMSPINREKLRRAKAGGAPTVGAIYKRTRRDSADNRVQRAEVRFDGVAGCLRTPVGGSSRQLILLVEGHKVRSRLLSPREAARLMGLPDSYDLPSNYNEAYHLAGDGLAVPVVRFLAQNLLEPLVLANTTRRQRAA